MATSAARPCAAYARTFGGSLLAASMDHLRKRDRMELLLGQPLAQVSDDFASVPSLAVGVEDDDPAVSQPRGERGENVRFGQVRIGVAGHGAPQHDPQAKRSCHLERGFIVVPVGWTEKSGVTLVARAQQIDGAFDLSPLGGRVEPGEMRMHLTVG